MKVVLKDNNAYKEFFSDYDMDYKKNLGFIFLSLIILVGVLGGVSANTIESSTMVFEGNLTPSEDGYEGIIDAVPGNYYIPEGPGTTWNETSARWETPDGEEAVGGFDVYAKDGGCSYVEGYYGEGEWNCNDDDTYLIGSNHDAYPLEHDGGPWGDFYSPDVKDWEHYELILDGDDWEVHYKDSESPFSGTINWENMYAHEDNQKWDAEWTWGEENIPLEYAGFDVEVTDLGDDEYKVTLKPANGAITNIDTGEVYDTIQEAVDDAEEGETIELRSGTYFINEMILIKDYGINKDNLIIKAAEGSTPIIEAQPDFEGDWIFRMHTPEENVTIEGLTILGKGYAPGGIYVNGNNNTVKNNKIEGVLYHGIMTSASPNLGYNTIYGNDISNVQNGIALQNDENYIDNNVINTNKSGFSLASKSTNWGTNTINVAEGGVAAHVSLYENNYSSKYSGSIQDAINGVNPGDTIDTDSGTFEEILVINKPLILRGATYDINKNGYIVPEDYDWNTSVESIIQPPEEANDYSAVVDIVDTDDVTFEGFIIQELNAVGNIDDSLLRVYAQTQEISNIVVRNNIIGPFTNTIFQDGTHGRMGLYIVNHPYSDEYGVVNSIFSGNKIFNCEGNGNNIFIWSSYSNPSYGALGPASMSGTVIEDNEIYGGHRSGIETAGGYSELTIRNNKIYNNGGSTTAGKPEIMFGNGIVLIRGSSDSHLEDNPGLGPEDLTIIDNEIYNNQRNAIYMGPINNNYTITSNEIYGNGWDGINLDFTALYHNPNFEGGDRIPWANQTEDIIVNENKIYDNGEYGARVVGEPTNGFILNAIDNWWGTNDGSEIATMVSENVDYDPWITQSQDTLTTGAETPYEVNTEGTNASITLTTSSSQSGTVTVQQSSSDSHGGFTASALGKFISINAEGIENITQVEIRIYYTDDELLASGIDETTLKLYWWNPGTEDWEVLADTGVNIDENYIWAITNHFSDYGGGGDPDTEGPEITNVYIEPLFPNLLSILVRIHATITDPSGVDYADLYYKIAGDPTIHNSTFEGFFSNGTAGIYYENPVDGATVFYHIKAVDMLGNYTWSPSSTTWYNFTYDGSAPITNLTISEPKYENGEDVYVSGGAEITLNCTDTISGCNETYFMVKYGEEIVQDWTIYTGPLPIPEDAEDGTHVVYYYSTDNAGNEEGEKSQEVIVDNTAPNVSIVYPINGIIYNSSINQLNYSASDSGSGLSSCWYNNGTTNSTPGACSNFTLSDSVEGLNNWIVYANDSVGNLNSATVYFTQDTISPLVSYNADTPEDNSYLNENSILINVSVTEENLDSVVLNLDGVNESIINNDGAGNYWINKIDLSDGNHSFYVWANDSVGHFNSTETRTVIIDTTNPLISYATGTPEDNANLSQDYVYVNMSLTELNFANITFSLYNSTGIVNSTNYNTEIKEINWTSLNEGRYSYNVTVYDLAGNKNSTETREILLDTTGPSIVITNIQDGENIACFQSVTAEITDTTSGVDFAYATILNSTSGVIANQTMIYDSSRGVWDTTFAGLCSEEVGDYTIKVTAYDIAGNSDSGEKEVYFPSIVAVFSEPQTCNVNPNTGGTCTMEFSFWIRGGNAVTMSMSDIDVATGSLSPTNVSATIFNDKGSAPVGNVNASGPIWNGGNLSVSAPVGYFNLNLTLPANFTDSTTVDYYIKPVIV